jgi:hypothetical protein
VAASEMRLGDVAVLLMASLVPDSVGAVLEERREDGLFDVCGWIWSCRRGGRVSE